MKVLALTKYGTRAASTRQRFLQYERSFKTAGIDLRYSPLLDNDYLNRRLTGQRPSWASIIRGYARRMRAIAAARSADAIWVHYEFLPYLPAFMERWAVGRSAKPIVYDFDDAIFHMYDETASSLVRIFLKDKLEPLLREAYACTCGNAYLEQYASRFCSRTLVVPTVVNTEHYRPGSGRVSDPITIGWIGSPSTWTNVRPLLPLLRTLCQTHQVRVRAVGAGAGAKADQFPGLELIDWSEATEVEEVQEMDIGIMPLLDRPFERGKSGYKLIQYMACGLPVVASPVGVNSDIVIDRETGFLATSDEMWLKALTRLIQEPELRQRFGKAARKRAVERYSLQSQAPRLVELFQSIAGKNDAVP